MGARTGTEKAHYPCLALGEANARCGRKGLGAEVSAPSASRSCCRRSTRKGHWCRRPAGCRGTTALGASRPAGPSVSRLHGSHFLPPACLRLVCPGFLCFPAATRRCPLGLLLPPSSADAAFLTLAGPSSSPSRTRASRAVGIRRLPVPSSPGRPTPTGVRGITTGRSARLRLSPRALLVTCFCPSNM